MRSNHPSAIAAIAIAATAAPVGWDSPGQKG